MGTRTMLSSGTMLLTAALLAQADGGAASSSVVQLSFTSSHHVLADHGANYRRGGKLFEGPAWTPEHTHAVTHTGGKPVEASVVVRVPMALPTQDVRVVGRLRGPRMGTVELLGTARVADGLIRARLRSSAPLPKGVYKETLTAEWFVDTGSGPIGVGVTGPHVVYVTLGTPLSERDPNEDIVHRYSSPLPPGVTVKRMEAAMKLVGRAAAEATTDTHELVGKLMDVFPGFLLAQGSHYVNDGGGAWLLADAIAESGECQAIVRLVKAVLDMVGAPGRLELVKLYADPDAPTVPIELPWGVDRAPPPAKQMKLMATAEGRRGWGVALLTGKPEFPDADEAKPAYGTCWKPGPIAAVTDRQRFLTEKPNNFQGALKVTAAGQTRYYGGGVGGYAFATKEDLFASTFWGMVWTMLVPSPVQERSPWDDKTAAAMRRMGVSPTVGRAASARRPGTEGFRLMEIIHIYDDEDRCR